MTHATLFADSALLPDGWARDVLFDIATDGNLAAVIPGAAGDSRALTAPRAAGPVIPGMPNLHSHAFQRAMAGLARSEEHTSELQSLMRLSYAVFCLKKKTEKQHTQN